MPTRFRLSTLGTRHHLMVDATTASGSVVQNRALACKDTSLALSLVLDEGDLKRLRAAVQVTDVAMWKRQLEDATAEMDRLRAELKAAQAERDAARADAICSKSAYDRLLEQWEKQ
ncbi:hypothetical protein ADL22_12250 [Streptomyces sp. NRRL F-4489]|uniref:hypothetical protein n=1 Tax=Streptomyces sp. NRRL F-4489 TaxID=1609095 RepID=UPI00074A3FD2|nr:hypothetical protein [Streptomyces sp. NRRL F-4489]KUL44708.1 hypothetical protein ADL22_12250 [Streptomyces sp. NRRL F-4489]